MHPTSPCAMLMIALVGCNASRTAPPDCPPQTQKCPTCSPAAVAVPVQNRCIRTDERLVIHVAIPTTKTRETPNPAYENGLIVWQLSCKARDCEGVRIDVGEAEKRGHLGLFDLNLLDGATVVSRTQSVAVIQWGPYRTFNVDFNQGRITYTESAENSEWRGEAKCATR